VFSRDTWLIANVQRFVKPGKESWHHDHIADFFDIFSARVLQHQVKGALQRRPEKAIEAKHAQAAKVATLHGVVFSILFSAGAPALVSGGPRG